jgi:hypothetical protein
MICCFAAALNAQTQSRGTWTAEAKKDNAEMLQLNLHRAADRMHMSNSVTLSDLQGLDPASVKGSNISVKFQILKDAGTVQFVGSFNQGLGHGEFNFIADQGYLSEMKQMGFTDVDQKAFELAMIDVSRPYVKEIRELGYKPNLEELVEGRIFKVGREQVAGLKGVGVNDLPIRKLVEYRIFDVTPEYIREMRAAFPNLSLDKMVEMRIHKATPQFAKEMAQSGYPNLSADDLVAFRIHGVTPEFIREVRGLGFTSLTADQLVEFRIFGVDADQVKELAKEGYTNLSAQQLVNFRIHKIDSKFIQKVKRAGYAHPSPDELVDFKIMGIRVREAEL